MQVAKRCIVKIPSMKKSTMKPISMSTMPTWKFVAFQTTEWIEKQFEKAETGVSSSLCAKLWGVSLRKTFHDGHADVTFRCAKPGPSNVRVMKRLKNGAEWLTKLGFAVKHDHE